MPASLKDVKIIVWDENKVVGDLEMEVSRLMSKGDEQDWNEEFDFQDNGAVAGSLKFQTIFGTNPSFSEVKIVHKKKKEVKKLEKK